MLTHIAECTSWIVLSKPAREATRDKPVPPRAQNKNTTKRKWPKQLDHRPNQMFLVSVCALPFNKVRYDPFTGRHLLDNRHGMHTEPLLDLQCPRGRERVNDLQANPIPREARPFPSSIDCHLH